MNIDKIVLAHSGIVVLLGVVLAHFFSPLWLWLDVLMGANLVQAAFSGFCPLAFVLKKIGTKPGIAFYSKD